MKDRSGFIKQKVAYTVTEQDKRLQNGIYEFLKISEAIQDDFETLHGKRNS